MEKMKTIYIITDIGRFIARSNDETGVLATHIHKFLIGLLEQCGQETESGYCDIQIFWHRESSDNCRKFIVSDELAALIRTFAHEGNLPKVIKQVKDHYIKEGTCLLLSLNNGDITMKDFENLKTNNPTPHHK